MGDMPSTPTWIFWAIIIGLSGLGLVLVRFVSL